MSAPGASTTPSDLAHRVRAATARARRALGDPRAAVNVRWLRALSGASNERILEVLGEVDSLVPVEEEIHRRHVAGGRANYAQFSAPLELYALVRLLQPRHVIETGVSSGLSSAHFLLALEKNRSGTLHSIDLPTPQRGPVLAKDESPVSIPPGLASGWAVPFRSSRWDLRIGDAALVLPALLGELPGVDLFLHDDLHTPERLDLELSLLRPKLPPGLGVGRQYPVDGGLVRPLRKRAARQGGPTGLLRPRRPPDARPPGTATGHGQGPAPELTPWAYPTPSLCSGRWPLAVRTPARRLPAPRVPGAPTPWSRRSVAGKRRCSLRLGRRTPSGRRHSPRWEGSPWKDCTLRGRRTPASRGSATRAPRPSRAASTRRCIGAASGRCGCSRGSARRRTRTDGSTICSATASPACRSRSTTPRSTGSTPTTRNPSGRSGSVG